MERLQPPLRVRVAAGISLTVAAALSACENESIPEVKQRPVESPVATQTLPTPSTARPTETAVIPKVETPKVSATPKLSPTAKVEPMPTPSPALNRVLKLDGRLDSVEFEGDKYLFEAPLRIEAKIKLDELDVGGNAIVSKGENDAIAFFASLTSCPERGMAVVVAGGQAVCGPSVQPGVWQEVSAEFDGENVRFFNNNVNVGEKPWKGSIPIEQGKLFAGKSPSGVLTQEYFGGEIDFIRIKNPNSGKVLFDAQFLDFNDSVTGNLGEAKDDAQLVVVD